MNHNKLKLRAWLLAGIGVCLIGIATLLWVFSLTRSIHWTSQNRPDSDMDSSCGKTLTNSLTEAQIDAMAKFLKNNIGPLDTTGMANQIIEIMSKDPKLRSLGCDSDRMREYIRQAFSNPEVSKQFFERALTEDQLKETIKQMSFKATKISDVSTHQP